MGVVERIGLIICECRSRLTLQKYTIHLQQTVLQEAQQNSNRVKLRVWDTDLWPDQGPDSQEILGKILSLS